MRSGNANGVMLAGAAARLHQAAKMPHPARPLPTKFAGRERKGSTHQPMRPAAARLIAESGQESAFLIA